MKKLLFLHLALFLFVIGSSNTLFAASRWGADYFPNTILTNQDGETFRFFDDLIKDKIVVVNFIYTSCPDVCPLETAQLTRVQRILGDRVGKDVFFYSISIDPNNDTPEVLKEYRERFGARWMFFTGKKQEIVTIRRKLGLYIEDIKGGENNHNVNMIIGNQKSGRWMKRSPFENPYVLADQIGNWLTGWKAPQQVKDYASAPELRNLSDGENLFRTRCLSCHSIDGKNNDGIGPDLLGVTKKRDRSWLINWLRAPDKMLAEKDPIAMQLYEQYNKIPMPNMSLTQVDVMDLIRYMAEETDNVTNKSGDTLNKSQKNIKFEEQDDTIAVMNAWIREALPGAKVNGGYMTLININPDDVVMVEASSSFFDKVEMHNMYHVNGEMRMETLGEVNIPAGGHAKFRPGGMHLMLIGPKKDLITGDEVDLTLRFASGKSQFVKISVKNK